MIINFSDFIKSANAVDSPVIVGSGIAAMALAHTLEKHGVACVIFESGVQGRKAEWNVTTEPLNGADYGVPESFTQLHIRREPGGGSSVWGGWCSTLRTLNLSRTDIPDYPSWPISRADLVPFYQRAAEWLKIPDPDGMLSDDIPFDSDEELVAKIWGFSPPLRFEPDFRKYLQESKNITLVTGATILSLDGEGKSVSSVLIKHDAGVASLHCESTVILAAGAVGNARILGVSASSLNISTDILGQLGKYFTEHPHCYSLGQVVFNPKFAGQITDDQTKWSKDVFVSIAPTQAYLTARRLMDFNFQLVKVAGDQLGPRAKALRENYRTIYGREPQYFQATLVMEQLARVTNYVLDEGTLKGANDGHLSIDFSPQLPIIELAKQWLFARGVHAWIEPDNVVPIQAVGHLHGTTRMGESPAEGVVDPSCRVFNLDNLYIAGSSIFPSAGFVNPTLTLAALAIRLGDHISRDDI